MQEIMGDRICQYRQINKMTQEEFARRLGVTPQAVSKWERGNGMPDVSLLEGICNVLGISANTLLGMDHNPMKNAEHQCNTDLYSHLTAEPLVLEFGKALIPGVSAGIEKGFVYQKRVELAKRTGMLFPIMWFQDNLELGDHNFRLLSYDKELFRGEVETGDVKDFIYIMERVVDFVQMHYDQILNKQLVKEIIDHVKKQYPGIADDLVPERISYLQVERKLQEKIKKGESIRDIIHILEEMEETLVTENVIK